jgi:hypothetical protein
MNIGGDKGSSVSVFESEEAAQAAASSRTGHQRADL